MVDEPEGLRRHLCMPPYSFGQRLQAVYKLHALYMNALETAQIEGDKPFGSPWYGVSLDLPTGAGRGWV